MAGDPRRYRCRPLRFPPRLELKLAGDAELTSRWTNLWGQARFIVLGNTIVGVVGVLTGGLIFGALGVASGGRLSGLPVNRRDRCGGPLVPCGLDTEEELDRRLPGWQPPKLGWGQTL